MVGTRNVEVLLVVDDICGVAVALVYAVLFPKHIHEERFHHFLTVCHDGVDAVHEIRVVHHHLRRLLRELVARMIHYVYQACVR